jgi:hypothetical protein
MPLGIFLTLIVEIFCNKTILTVGMICATCLQIQAKQRNHKPVNTNYADTKILATTWQKLLNPNKMLKLP